jgi:hypothetical protein
MASVSFKEESPNNEESPDNLESFAEDGSVSEKIPNSPD